MKKRRHNKYKKEAVRITPGRHEEIKKAIIALLTDGIGGRKKKAMSDAAIASELHIKGRETGEMASCLDELEAAGNVFINRKGRYRVPEPDSVLTGTVQITKRGFGFLLPDDGSADVFLPREDVNGAMDGDKAVVKIDMSRRHKGHRYGWVMKITERATSEVTGTVEKGRGFSFVVPDNRRIGDIYIKKSDAMGAGDGDKVRAVITKYESDGVGLRGRITEIYGKAGDAQAELKAVLRQYSIPEAFSDEVTAAAAAAAAARAACSGREDLRDRLVITIDGPDAKDLDDAVSVEKRPDGTFLLGVHIADVSHYVKEDSVLDREALKRGCSVYLLDAVVPMLPEALSNGVCSLNEGEDRLTLSVEAVIDGAGDVKAYRIYESVIRSAARMVYDDVSDIIEHHDKTLMKKYRKLCPMIFAMDELASVLRRKRMKGGSLDFDIAESYIELDKNGVPVDIRPAERRVANRIIEEFMLKANQIVAEHHFWMEVPFVYRVHERPDNEKMESFRAFAGTLGYSLKGSCDSIRPSALRDILLKAAGSENEGIISRVMLRSMKKADYQPTCSGHFGLGFKYYCHFTSPIRRYPDLMVHRIIKEMLHGGKGSLTSDKERRSALTAAVSRACEISSAQERNAIDAERTIEKKKKVVYMKSRIDAEYEGIISGVLGSGFFVELPNTVEGFVAAETLTDDYYALDADNYRLTGEHTGKVYPMGARVRVRVSRVSLTAGEIDFTVIN